MVEQFKVCVMDIVHWRCGQHEHQDSFILYLLSLDIVLVSFIVILCMAY
jgi:hypothetical protein